MTRNGGSAGDGATERGSVDLAAKIDHLFNTLYPAGRGPYSYKEVADGIAARTGERVNPTTLWKLRTGKADNPTKRVIEGLAAFFGVDPGYFFDDEVSQAVGDELETLALLRDSGIRRAHLRALAGLSPEAVQVVAQVIQSTAALEASHGRPRPARDAAGPRPADRDGDRGDGQGEGGA
ncbi:helix-turn-helix domain-containing protein [Actinoallomurus rhizosphaericola]|uniref:helix-turn-helix domain-containing protein n=1 Tax=Actinoallomurus rhizosphaericola TaxID=2952536 RepID=UPI0020931E7E|nr:helix-turn-helix domain-containing protein [Actinoallomurus rhizosphaericola]MCO5995866.1 helix-turn-helix domain-containing protein [Actinoallomurus rhizosphaericola]